jgi:hypothetical protein
MRQLIWSTLLVWSCLSAAAAADLQEDRRQALALWEQAVAAKGGRERLAAINSFAIQKRTAFSRLALRDMATGKVEQIACALPDAWWEFVDYRPGKMGYSVLAANARTGLGWATHGGPAHPFLRRYTGLPYRMRQLQYVYFLETRDVRPTPIRASRARRGFTHVDRVETLVDDDLVVFDLDVKTHLPIRIETTHKNPLKPPRPGMPPPGDMRFVYELADYHDVGGILVPARVTLGGDTSHVQVEIDPDYDPAIFITAPSPTATIDSWRRQRAGVRLQTPGSSF